MYSWREKSISALLVVKHARYYTRDMENTLLIYRQVTSNIRCFYGYSIKKGATMSPRGEKLLHERIINYTDLRFLVHH